MVDRKMGGFRSRIKKTIVQCPAKRDAGTQHGIMKPGEATYHPHSIRSSLHRVADAHFASESISFRSRCYGL